MYTQLHNKMVQQLQFDRSQQYSSISLLQNYCHKEHAHAYTLSWPMFGNVTKWRVTSAQFTPYTTFQIPVNRHPARGPSGKADIYF